MSYTLQSIISDISLIEKAKKAKLPCVSLSEELAMIPLTYAFVENSGMSFLPLTDEGKVYVEGKLKDLCLELSKDSKLAYVEAEFWGGDGTQACWLVCDGIEEENPRVSISAINYALAWLGVKPIGSQDEFGTIGLGRERNTSDWIK